MICLQKSIFLRGVSKYYVMNLSFKIILVRCFSEINHDISPEFFPQQQNAMGSLRNIDFGASWGGSGKEPGNRFRVQFPEPGPCFDGFGRVRFCSQGLDGTRSGNRVPGTRRRFQVPEIPFPGFRRRFPRFRKLLCTSKVYFCTLKV